MAGLSDMERIMARLSMGHGGPRDLSGLANGLASASEIVTIATNVRALAEPHSCALFDAIMVPAPLADELGPALADDLPLLARDGGLVRRGYDLALDEIRDLRDESAG